MLIKSKKGQASDAVTWIVATIVIVVIMIFFIFSASIFSETKKPGKYKATLFSMGEDLGDDIFMKKTLYSYVDYEDKYQKRKLLNYLKKKDSQNGFNLPMEDTMKQIQLRYDLNE